MKKRQSLRAKRSNLLMSTNDLQIVLQTWRLSSARNDVIQQTLKGIIMGDLKTKLKQIKLVILDVDGVLTDDTVWMGPDNIELKRFCIADGLGMVMARRRGIKIALLSGRPSPATTARAEELQIEDVYQGYGSKIDFYNTLKDKYKLNDSEIAFMGNDMVDLEVLKTCGLPIAVPGSPKSIIDAAEYVTSKSGGFGAVREVFDMILEAHGIPEENRLD